MNLGENIYRYRIGKNLSQGDLANELEVSRQSVSKWENNSAVPELDKMIRMSRLFGVTIDELVYGAKAEEKQEESPIANWHLPPTRVIVGFATLVFGMVFFLLSIFWGNHLRLGEEFGELTSITIVVLSMALFATYNHKLLAICAIVYFFYSFVCFGVLQVTSLTNYFFLFGTGVVLLVWFIVWGLDANARAEKKTSAEAAVR